jgi:hypothetical protein
MRAPPSQRLLLTMALGAGLLGCGGGGGAATRNPSNPLPSQPDFTLSASPSTVSIARENSDTVQISVTPMNGFAETVTVTPTGLPTGVTSAPINVVGGGTGTLTINVSSATGPGPFTISLAGTSGTVSHSATVNLKVPYGGGVLTLVPRTTGTHAFPQSAVPYINKLIADIAPARLPECGSASASHTIEVVYNPAQGFKNFDENALVINMDALPAPRFRRSRSRLDIGLMHESTHALQADLLRIVNGVNRRGTIADAEGIAQACAYRIARSLALSGKRSELRTGGDLPLLWLDTFRRDNPETVAAGGWITTSGAHVQPMRTLGEAVYLLASTQEGAGGDNGIIEHENALFAAESNATQPLIAAERIQIWDSLGFELDGQATGAWMPPEMIEDPDFTVGKPHLIAWPVLPQLPTQMMAQALVVESDDPSFQPVVQAITSGPLTITVGDNTPQQNIVLGPIQADFSETSGISNYSVPWPNPVPQGTFTVSVDATVNGTSLHTHFVIANIPFQYTGVGSDDLAFPGQYVIAVDNEGKANGGSLNVTRGTVVWSMKGLAIVKPDSTGTFDVIGPAGLKRTYTAPEPWARFIPVE